MTGRPAPFPAHPERDALQAEAHARPPLAITSPAAIIHHWVLFDVPQDAALPEGFDPQLRHQLTECHGVTLRVERHTEFLALTALGGNDLPAAFYTLIGQFPGQLLAGVKLTFQEEISSSAEAAMFGDTRLFGGETCDGAARLSTDFQLGEDGLVQYLVMGTFTDPYARGRLAKRLIDLETYRMASLLGLPAVRQHTPSLVAYERKATEITGLLAGKPSTNLSGTIEALGSLLAGVQDLRESTRYRLAASDAYYAIVSTRLEHLAETEVLGRQTLRGFIEHRLAPAIATVRAFDRRLEDLSATVTAAMALARTRIDLAQQAQNQEHLASIERRARQQVHLAQTVEGLSVAAITYYFAGLVSAVLKGLPDFGISDTVATAISVPIIAFLVFRAARRARRAIGHVAS